MPRWTREPNADQRIELAIAGFKIGLYKSREDTIKSHGVNPNTLRRRLNGKHKFHKVAHTYRQSNTDRATPAEQRQRQFRAALLASKEAQKALETASRIATKKKAAKAREEFRKAEDLGV